MISVDDILKRTIQLDRDFVFELVFRDREIQQFIIDKIRFDQLFQKGENAQGIKLSEIGGEYSEFTKLLKERKGLPTDRITLFDTGDFYKSFAVSLKDGYIEIFAETLKDQEDGSKEDILKRWGKEILGLNEENTNELISMVLPKINQVVLAIIQGAPLQRFG